MATIKVAYASTANFALTLASLSNSATVGRESTAIDNSTNLYVDVLVQVKVAVQSGAAANDKAVYVYAYGSEDGSTYTDNATGSNAAITLRAPTAMAIVGVIPCPDGGVATYESQPMSIAAAFGGHMPRKWGIVVRNYTGQALSASEGDHTYKYTGITYTSA